MPSVLCGRVWSQHVVRVNPAEFIQPKQTKIWPCDWMVLHQLYVQEKNGPCPGATQLSLFHILSELPGEPELDAGVTTWSWKCRATGSLKGGARGPSVRRRTGQSSGKVGCGPSLQPHNLITDTPLVCLDFYTLGQGNWFFHRV